LSAISSATYDADHDVLTSTDANGNVTTNSYQYVGPNGSTGLLTQTVRPPIRVPPLLAEVEEDVQFLDAALLFVEQADSAQALKEVQVDLVAAGFSLPGEKVRPTQPAPQGKGGKYHPGGKEAPRESPAAPALRFTTRDGWRSWSAAAPARTRS
jgi:hypothetical protein